MSEIPRAFIAVPLPETLRDAAVQALHDLQQRIGHETFEQTLRPVHPANFHLTLRFLGALSAAQLDTVSQRMKQAASAVPHFRYELGGVIGLPSPARLRVLAVAVKPCPTLAQLAGEMEAAAVAAGLAPERRPFRPHITVARVRRRTGRPLRLPPEPPAVDMGAEAAEVILFRSDREKGRPVYTPVVRCPFGGGAAHASGDTP